MTNCLLCSEQINTFLEQYYKTPNGSVCKKCGDELFGMTKGFELMNTDVDVKQKFDLKPVQIYEKLNDYIIGQDDAKKTLSIAVYNHYKRLTLKKSNIYIDKSNILIIGPSGSGKTLLCKTIAKLLDVPYVICDATTFTQAGYIGEDVESMLTKLYIASDYDIEKTERGIIFIDEIDKISEVKTMGRDASGLGVQQALLKFLEGSKVNVPTKLGRHPQCDNIEINTDNILFICSGAFVNLNEISVENLINFGIIPEMLGRLPIIVKTNELTRDDIKRIITEPKNNILQQYVELFKLDGIELKFKDEALELIYDKCYESKLGARGIRTIFEIILKDAMFSGPGKRKKFIVSETTVKHTLKLTDEHSYIII
jgi:ATP-dependent Clp protease ATP-binding subunit ClpX